MVKILSVVDNFVQLDSGVYLAPEYPMFHFDQYQIWFDMNGMVNYGLCNSYHQVLDVYHDVDPNQHILILTKCLSDINLNVDWGQNLLVSFDEMFHFHIFKLIVSQ